MVRFSIFSDRYVPLSPGVSLPVFDVVFGHILDVDVAQTSAPIEWDVEEGHPVLVGDAQRQYKMIFHRAPNWVYNMILLLQQHGDQFPGVNGVFVEIEEGSAFELFEDGVEKPVEAGAFLPI
jgi:hypothetical protein